MPDAEAREHRLHLLNLLWVCVGLDGDAGARHIFGDGIDCSADNPAATVHRFQLHPVAGQQIENVRAFAQDVLSTDSHAGGEIRETVASGRYLSVASGLASLFAVAHIILSHRLIALVVASRSLIASIIGSTWSSCMWLSSAVKASHSAMKSLVKGASSGTIT